MKIALVLSSPPGYSETFFNSLIKGLKEEGHELTLYTGYASQPYDLCKHVKHPAIHKFYVIQVFLMLYRGLTLLPYFKTIQRYFRLEKNEGTPLKRILEKIYLNAALLKFQGDWIHFGFATTALHRELVSDAVGSKMAVSLRGYDINVYPLKYVHSYDLLWRQVDKVHSISSYLLNKAYDLGLDRTKSFQVIHPAGNLENFPKPVEHKMGTKFRIVTIARFGWIKGLELLTEAALILKRSGLDFEWILIGTGSSSEKERYLFDVHEKQLQEQLIHKGQCSHKETLEILKDADVYVQTSLNEGFCNAVLEAQALGIPCVAFRVGGLPENVVDGETGWLIESFDTPKMAEKIEEILHLTTEQKNRMAQQSIERVRKDFNMVKQKREFNEFYQF